VLIYTACISARPFPDRFTMWRTTSTNDGGIRRQAVTSGELLHQTHLQAASRRPCSRTMDYNAKPKPVPNYRPRRHERLGLPEDVRMNTLLKDAMHWCVAPSSGDEPATPNLESDVLTTRPTRLTFPATCSIFPLPISVSYSI
jgi:hypothetical protein